MEEIILARYGYYASNIDQNIRSTFKWSRENGSLIFPITEISGNKITLEHLGRDNCFGFKPKDWVEIADDVYTLQNRAENLLQVESIDHKNRQVTLKYMDGNLAPFASEMKVSHFICGDGSEKGFSLSNG